MDSIKLQQIQDDFKEVKGELSKVFLLTSTMQVPITLYRLQYDTFWCEATNNFERENERERERSQRRVLS